METKKRNSAIDSKVKYPVTYSLLWLILTQERGHHQAEQKINTKAQSQKEEKLRDMVDSEKWFRVSKPTFWFSMASHKKQKELDGSERHSPDLKARCGTKLIGQSSQISIGPGGKEERKITLLIVRVIRWY